MSSKFIAELAKSKAAANRVVRSVDATITQKAIQNLQAALTAEKKRADSKAAKKQAANLKKLKAMMAEMGLSAADLRKVAGKRPARKAAAKKAPGRAKRGPRKGKKVAPKYQIKVGKQLHKWTGRGRMPLVFKEFVEKGGSLDKCLIK